MMSKFDSLVRERGVAVLWCLSVSYWVPSRSCETSHEHAIDLINVAPIFECFDRDTHAQIEWRDQSAEWS